MERLTGHTCKQLLEAYSAIYDEYPRTELNEEEVKEFLELINSLVEEGYDLSEYTYDELYEQYITESGAAGLLKSLGGRLLTAARGAVKTGWKGTTVQTKKGPKFVPGAEQEVKAAIANTLRRGVKIGVPVGAVAAADQWATGGGGRRWVGQQVQSARQAAHGDQPATAKPQPQQEKPKTQSLKILGGKVVGYDHFDMFDAVKGHLIGEGYAETEEAALAIMANMSEEWKQSIIESLDPDSNPKGTYKDFEALNNLNKKLKSMSPGELKNYLDNLPRVGPGGSRLKGA